MVYRLQCENCPKRYIGQTGNALTTRVKQHRAACRLQHLDKSAVTAHSLTEGHRIAWNDAKVLAQESNYTKRRFLESWHIRASTNCLNRTNPIPSRYDDIVKAWRSAHT